MDLDERSQSSDGSLPTTYSREGSPVQQTGAYQTVDSSDPGLSQDVIRLAPLEERFPFLQEQTGKRRSRQLLTPRQKDVLMQILARTRFPSTAVREAAAKELGLSNRKIQVFFQNKRQGLRKRSSSCLDGNANSSVSSLSKRPSWQLDGSFDIQAHAHHDVSRNSLSQAIMDAFELDPAERNRSRAVSDTSSIWQESMQPGLPLSSQTADLLYDDGNGDFFSSHQFNGSQQFNGSRIEAWRQQVAPEMRPANRERSMTSVVHRRSLPPPLPLGRQRSASSGSDQYHRNPPATYHHKTHPRASPYTRVAADSQPHLPALASHLATSTCLPSLPPIPASPNPSGSSALRSSRSLHFAEPRFSPTRGVESKPRPKLSTARTVSWSGVTLPSPSSRFHTSVSSLGYRRPHTPSTSLSSFSSGRDLGSSIASQSCSDVTSPSLYRSLNSLRLHDGDSSMGGSETSVEERPVYSAKDERARSNTATTPTAATFSRGAINRSEALHEGDEQEDSLVLPPIQPQRSSSSAETHTSTNEGSNSNRQWAKHARQPPQSMPLEPTTSLPSMAELRAALGLKELVSQSRVMAAREHM